ncbi:isocitrate lyase/phosphoenolpyruvate mutase family protein [Labilibaculum sp. DW002]|uniref:Isocitrate lyase/phosphoenolpyruvate mutase family protein n=1 Tax=Paralabilibaculum antarcticum TaxID=2912572 RepID=A0ABT5VUU9_9BACT|nr:isocitrate lyase/phosphoenolpyruvate mutase family protein [Labilibaculum sp. DW002]MDE5419200.1 isocitrate lyase/phosphoenolpyruvate mutase family protein [Labilibaculum sp. DW002]
MIIEKQIELAKKFHQLHQEKQMLVLPNAWSAGSAIVFEKQGFNAVATTSAGIAYSLGYPDGEGIHFEDLCTVVKQITKRISIPLSVDFECGYGESVAEVKENAKKLILAGAVGINIEDGLPNGNLNDLDFQLEKIESLVQLKEELGIPFVINARTCVYWLDVADDASKIATAIERGNAFVKSGADCVFIPGALSEEIVETLVSAIDAPLNIIANPLFNDFQKLNRIGVRRLSVGSGAVRSAFNHLIAIGDNLKKGDISLMLNHQFSYKYANEFFE